MGNNFYQMNNEILKLDPYKEKDFEKIQFNHYLCRKENLQRTKEELDRGLFKLSYTTMIADTGLKRWKVQELIKWFEDNKIIECIEKSDSKGKESIYAYTSVYYAENELKNHTDNHTNNHTDFHTSKKEKEKENKKEKKNNIYSISSLAFTKIFDLWNSKNIVKHKNITDNMVKAYKNISGLYTDNEIVEAIENYNKCLKDDNFYYTHRFTLEKFLKQSNGISNFVNDGEMYINYLNQVNTSLTKVDVEDEKYKDTYIYKGHKVKAKFYPRKHLSYYNCDNEYIEVDNGLYEIPYSEVKRVNKESKGKYIRAVEVW